MIRNDASKMTVLAPSWVMKALSRNNLLNTDLLDLAKVRRVCSAEDLVLVMAMNQDASLFFGVPVTMTLLDCSWRSTDIEFYTELQKSKVLYPGIQDPRLYADENTPPDGAKDSTACTAFDVTRMRLPTMAGLAMLVTVFPANFGENRTELQKTCRRQYLEQSYVALNIDDLAQSPIFGRFVHDV